MLIASSLRYGAKQPSSKRRSRGVCEDYRRLQFLRYVVPKRAGGAGTISSLRYERRLSETRAVRFRKSFVNFYSLRTEGPSFEHRSGGCVILCHIREFVAHTPAPPRSYLSSEFVCHQSSETKFLRRILPHYYEHVKVHPETFLVRFYGMYRVKMHHLNRKVHFIVMNRRESVLGSYVEPTLVLFRNQLGSLVFSYVCNI